MPLLSLVLSQLLCWGRPRADKCSCQTARCGGRAGIPHTRPSGVAAGVGKACCLLLSVRPSVRALFSFRRRGGAAYSSSPPAYRSASFLNLGPQSFR